MNGIFEDEVQGDLFSQARNTIDLLRTKYMKAAISYAEIQRIETFPIPYAALREAVLNAIVHRDYMTPVPIQIRVYADKLKIWNPAVLPEGWTIDKLLGEHSSHPFNPDVANAFFRAGEIESWGRGIERILSSCRDADAPIPQIRLDANDLWFEFPFPPKYLEIIAKEKQSPKTVGLVENQRMILEILKESPRTSKRELAERIGISTTAVDNNIEALKEKRLPKRIGSAKHGYWEVLG